MIENYIIMSHKIMCNKVIDEYGASLGGAKSNVFNPSLGLKNFILSYLSQLSCTRLQHTTSEDDQMRKQKKLFLKSFKVPSSLP